MTSSNYSYTGKKKDNHTVTVRRSDYFPRVTRCIFSLIYEQDNTIIQKISISKMFFLFRINHDHR